MQDSLFTVELPLVNSNEELERVKAMYPEYDPYFIASGCIKERKEKFEKLWHNFRPYADKHFLTEIKTNFHQRSWEMYLGNVFLQKKLSIRSQDEGPDFVVNNNIYIECVAPTKGDLTKPDSVPEMFIAKTPKELRVQDIPEDKILLRISQAIKEKLNQYEKWKFKNWFNQNASFVIAINTGDLEYPEDPNMPNVLKVLFGFQYMQINIKTKKISYSYRSEIKKSNNKPVPVNYFIRESFSFVSGVLFSNETVVNHPDKIGDDCIFVNNPFSSSPVDQKFVKLFKNWRAEKNNGIVLQKNY